MSAASLIPMIRNGEVVMTAPSEVMTAQQAAIDSLGTSLATALDRIAALEGRSAPVTLSAQIAPATLTIGTSVLTVPVTGLLATHAVLVQPAADMPVGLAIAWAHPKQDGQLTVALGALLAVTIKTPIALTLRAFKA